MKSLELNMGGGTEHGVRLGVVVQQGDGEVAGGAGQSCNDVHW